MQVTIANGTTVDFAKGDRARVNAYSWMGQSSRDGLVIDLDTESSRLILRCTDGQVRTIAGYDVITKLAK